MDDVHLIPLTTALDVVLRDIRSGGWEPREAHVFASDVWEGPQGRSGRAVVAYGGHEFPVDVDRPFGEQVAAIASRLQDDVVDDVGEGWPMSADGRRLLTAAVRDSDGSAWWLDGDVPVAPVGGLGRR